MRAFLFDLLVTDPALQGLWEQSKEQLMKRVHPRESQLSAPEVKPYLMYGLGNNTNEQLSEDPDHQADRQFFTIWVHDEGGSYQLIDDTLTVVKKRLINASHVPSRVSNIIWLENSQEFANESYGTIFRYSRYQAIISKGSAA